MDVMLTLDELRRSQAALNVAARMLYRMRLATAAGDEAETARCQSACLEWMMEAALPSYPDGDLEIPAVPAEHAPIQMPTPPVTAVRARPGDGFLPRGHA